VLSRSTVAAIALVLVATTSVGLAEESAKKASSGIPERWFDAYDEGVAAVRNKDWKRAEAMLFAAKQRHPEQGPNVLYYGQTYKPFAPDYYLAQVYLNTGRAELALTTAKQVSNQKLVEDTKSLDALITQAGDAVLTQAEAAMRSDNRREVERLVSVASESGVSDARMARLQAYLAAKPAPTPIAPNPYPTIATAQTLWGNGVRAFLAGDYSSATSLLASANTADAPPRMRLYLVCAMVGQVLVGQGDASMLKTARETFRSANLARAMTSDDTAYISPRILDQLQSR